MSNGPVNDPKATAGSEISFEDLIRLNEDDLLRYFRGRLTNAADAAEAFGELLLAAWKLRRKIPADPVDGRMWLFATARNVLRNSRRSVARRSNAVQRLAQQIPQPDPTATTDDAVEVRAAIDGLPRADAELIRLIYWDGFASHEAATILGINPSTARSRLAKAKLALRDTLDPDAHRSAN